MTSAKIASDRRGTAPPKRESRRQIGEVASAMITSKAKKRLGQASVKDPDLILEQCDPQSPEDALENDCA